MRTVSDRWILAWLACVVFVFALAISAGAVTITWWQSWTDTAERAATLESLVAEFERENPGIEVNLEFVAWNQLGERFRVALAGGAPPEVVMLLPEDCVALGAQGVLVPLDPYVQEYGVDLDAFIAGDLVRGVVSGQLCGLPHISGAGQRFIAYNKRIFDELGLPDQAPETWTDLRDVSSRSMRTSADGTVELAGYLDYGAWTFWSPFIYSNAGQLFTESGTVATIDSPEVAQTIDYLADLVALQGGHATTTQLGNRINAFVGGRRTVIGGAQSLFKDLGDRGFDLRDLGIGPIPYNEQNPDASSQGITISGWYLAIPKGLTREEEDAAFRWIEFMTARADQGARFPMSMGRPSPLIEVNFDPAYYDVNPLWGQVIELFSRDVAFPVLPVTEEIMQQVHAQVMRVIRGEAGSMGVLEESQRIAEQRLAAYLEEQ